MQYSIPWLREANFKDLIPSSSQSKNFLSRLIVICTLGIVLTLLLRDLLDFLVETIIYKYITVYVSKIQCL
jgi:hypothetical protein